MNGHDLFLALLFALALGAVLVGLWLDGGRGAPLNRFERSDRE